MYNQISVRRETPLQPNTHWNKKRRISGSSRSDNLKREDLRWMDVWRDKCCQTFRPVVSKIAERRREWWPPAVAKPKTVFPKLIWLHWPTDGWNMSVNSFWFWKVFCEALFRLTTIPSAMFANCKVTSYHETFFETEFVWINLLERSDDNICSSRENL